MENIFVDLTAALWKIIRPILTAMSPLLIGLVLAYLLHPAVDFLRKKIGTVWAIFVTYLCLFVVLISLAGGFVVLILGALPTGSWQETLSLVIAYFEDAYRSALSFVSRYFPASLMGAESGMTMTPEQASTWIMEKLSSRFSLHAAYDLLESMSAVLVNLFLGLVASIYLLKDKDFFVRLWERFLSLTLKQKSHGLVNETMEEINGVITTFLKGALVDSLLVAFLSSVVLSILKVDFAVVIGIFGGLLNIIPYFGPFFGMVPAFLVALFTGGLGKAVAAVLALFLVQQADCNFIYPRIVGSTTGLHPLFVLLSVSVLGHFLGVPGMILAVPIAGIIQIFIRRWAYR